MTLEHLDTPSGPHGAVPLGRVLARLFGEYADLIEIEGTDPRKASAYRRAAIALRDLQEPLEVLVAEGRVTSLQGVGPVLAAKITEFVRTGAIADLEKLRAQIPAGVSALLELRGVGPKLVATVWRELGVTSMPELRAAAADGRLASVSGVGPARAKKVLEAIAAAESPLLMLAEVLPLCRALADVLGRAEGCSRAAVAGEARRGCPTVRCAELVAAGTPEAVAAALAATPLAWSAPPQIRSEGVLPWAEVRATVAEGPEVRVMAVPAEAFGSALCMATGSEGHLAAIAAWRRAQGNADAPLPLLPDEEALYAAAGLPWIAPELREGWGEVEAAAAGRLPPRLVELGDLQGDVHCHSTFSDGLASVEAMAAAARARGYRYLSLADHTRSLVIASGMSIDDLRAQRRRIDEINAAATDGFRLLQGAEVEILKDGSLDYPDEILGGLDFCVASLHNTFGQSGAELTRRSLRALEHPAVDLLGHPTGRRIGRRDAYPVDVPALVQSAREHGKAIEVNGSPERLDLDGVHNRLLPPAGVPTCLDSDAHSPDGLAGAEFAVITARRGAIGPDLVLNTRPLEALLAWKQARQQR